MLNFFRNFGQDRLLKYVFFLLSRSDRVQIENLPKLNRKISQNKILLSHIVCLDLNKLFSTESGCGLGFDYIISLLPLKAACSLSNYTVFLLKTSFPQRKTIRKAPKGGKPDRKPYDPYIWFQKSIQKNQPIMSTVACCRKATTKVETSSLRNLKPQRNCTFVNSISG